MAALGTEVVSDLRRATGVKHDRRTEPSATNSANAGSPKYQLNLAVTSTANDGRKPSHSTGAGSILHRPAASPTSSRFVRPCAPASFTVRQVDRNTVECVTGMLDGDGDYAAHGHLIRLRIHT